MAERRLRGRRPLSVRARTTLAAALVVAVALLLGGTALVSLLRRSLEHHVDDVAEARAIDIAALAAEAPLPARIAGPAEDALVQVVGPDGRVVSSSANAPAGLHQLAKARPRRGADPAVTTVDNLPGLPGRARLLVLRPVGAGEADTIVVAASLEPAGDAVGVVRAGLLTGGPLLVAMVAALAWLGVGRALAPVEAIRRRAAALSSRDLDARLPVPATSDEISRLAETMNAMLDRLQTASDRQRRFVADASHELRTPLAAVRTDLEVALAHPGATDWPGTATDLLNENRHMERLVSDLLFIARADDGAPTAPPSPVDLHEVVQAEAARLSGERPVDITRVAEAFVVGRRNDLARAVRNLLDNAVRHAASAVTVELGGDDDGTVTLVVADDGAGVDPDDRERIFERFTRLDGARSRGTGGAGLGLAIVREIVERHGGRVWAEGDGTGARFVVTLPSDEPAVTSSLR